MKYLSCPWLTRLFLFVVLIGTTFVATPATVQANPPYPTPTNSTDLAMYYAGRSDATNDAQLPSIRTFRERAYLAENIAALFWPSQSTAAFYHWGRASVYHELADAAGEP